MCCFWEAFPFLTMYDGGHGDEASELLDDSWKLPGCGSADLRDERGLNVLQKSTKKRESQSGSMWIDHRQIQVKIQEKSG